MQIRAAVTHEKCGPFVLQDVDLAEPGPQEMLVRIVATGLCHTDLAVRDQHLPLPLPIVLGHEGAGVVEQVGPDAKGAFRPGDKVVLTFNSCGHCAGCVQGRSAYCDNAEACNFSGVRMGGTPAIHLDGRAIGGSFFQQSSFATHALVSDRNAVKITHEVTEQQLALFGPLGCGIQTGAGAVLNALKATAGSSIAIFGSGAVGLSAVMGARLGGCGTIIAIDINDARLELAQALGATHVINPLRADPLEAVRAFTRGLGADYSLECTALPKLLRTAVECLHKRGICGLVGLPPAGTEVTLDMYSVLSGRTLRGIVEGDSVPQIFINQLIEACLQGRFPIDRLMTHYRFDEINRAVKDSESGTTVKAVLHMA